MTVATFTGPMNPVRPSTVFKVALVAIAAAATVPYHTQGMAVAEPTVIGLLWASLEHVFGLLPWLVAHPWHLVAALPGTIVLIDALRVGRVP